MLDTTDVPEYRRAVRQRGPRRRALDPLDEKIIALLQADGRRPNTDIARQLGVAEATIRKRIERMVRDQVMQVGAWADPLKIGLGDYVIIEIQAEPSQIERVAERLAKLPEICFLGICTGAYDINAAAVFVSSEHRYHFMMKRLAQVPGIERTATSSIMRVVKRQYSYPIPGVHLSLDGIGPSPPERPVSAEHSRGRRSSRGTRRTTRRRRSETHR